MRTNKIKYPKLLCRIIEKHGNVKDFCRTSGMSYDKILRTLKGTRRLTADDIRELSEILEIPRSEQLDTFIPDGMPIRKGA